MKVTLWGTRGSIASAGPETVAWGGDTACVQVEAADGSVVLLDAGTGIRRAGMVLSTPCRVDVLLTHLHMDHIQGLGFFEPLFRAGSEVHLWGPRSTTLSLAERLGRYLSPPLFPVRLRDVEARLQLHDVPEDPFRIGGLEVLGRPIIHPGPTLGYRLRDGGRVIAYLPDHEPALGAERFPDTADWTSGHDLSAGADLLLHDSQYTAEEYERRVGWGHSRIDDTVAFAVQAGVRELVTFHHDPAHDDADLDALLGAARDLAAGRLAVSAGREGALFTL